MTKYNNASVREIIFGLGCFWSVQKYFDETPGVLHTQVGYAGGTQDHASYDDIGDHTEVIKIQYDANQISYTEMIQKFVEKKDPTFPGYKTQYDSLILHNTPEEENIAEEILSQIDQKSDRKTNVRVEKNGLYFPAEEYHQKYIEKRENRNLTPTLGHTTTTNRPTSQEDVSGDSKSYFATKTAS